jgi:glutaredoxin 3
MEAELFTRPGCGYCVAAKQLLVRKNIKYVERDITNRADWDEIKSRVPGFRTVPQIFLDGRHIGGFDDLSRYFRDSSELTQPKARPENGAGASGRFGRLFRR